MTIENHIERIPMRMKVVGKNSTEDKEKRYSLIMKLIDPWFEEQIIERQLPKQKYEEINTNDEIGVIMYTTERKNETRKRNWYFSPEEALTTKDKNFDIEFKKYEKYR